MNGYFGLKPSWIAAAMCVVAFVVLMVVSDRRETATLERLQRKQVLRQIALHCMGYENEFGRFPKNWAELEALEPGLAATVQKHGREFGAKAEFYRLGSDWSYIVGETRNLEVDLPLLFVRYAEGKRDVDYCIE